MNYQPPPPPPPPPPYGYQPGYGYGGYPPQGYWQPPPPPIDPSRLRPPRLWYFLSAIPILLGVVIAVAFVVKFVDELDPDIDNFRSNRAAQVDVKSGERAIYIQTRVNGVPIRVPPDDLRCSVTSLGGNPQPVNLERAGGSTLDVNDDSYNREFKFDAPRDGTYRVLCEGPEGVRLAIGPDLSFALFVPLIVAIGSLILGGILTVVGMVVTAVRRSNHKQHLQREARAGMTT